MANKADAKETNYEVMFDDQKFPVKMWTKGVAVEDEARAQLKRIANMPFIHRWVAVMPDVHLGKGATVGSVIATHKAIIPAAVGVDLGCGMMAVQTSLRAEDLPDNLQKLRSDIERAVPHGRTDNGGKNDRGTWKTPTKSVANAWKSLAAEYQVIVDKYPKIDRGPHMNHLGTLGTGNHFIEMCLDEKDQVWFMLHSGSRGVGNRIGSFFIQLAKEDMRRWHINLPDSDLAYLPEGTEHFDDYTQAVLWAQSFARTNRELMMEAVIHAAQQILPPFALTSTAVNCHHNYVDKEFHFGDNVWVTRKGAVRARENDLGIIPGSMGTRSYIVRGKGNPDSFHSCSHGAGRSMSRTAAKKRFSLEDHKKATAGIECRKDEDVIDETPAAYKPIEDVMKAQADLVDIVHTLRQVLCVKGLAYLRGIMLLIDGSQGEGGGQILRTSLSLSLLTKQAFKLEKIRAGRHKPGLMRQHLTAVQSAAEIGQAKLLGAEIRSQELTFVPGKLRSGDFSFSIGTAGSATLVFQTLLPALLKAEQPSKLRLEGGTHNSMAPPFDFLERSFLRCLQKIGVRVQLQLERPGFYPAGGGCFIATIEPWQDPIPLSLLERGQHLRSSGRVLLSMLPGNIAHREITTLTSKLGWERKQFEWVQVERPFGPGNIIALDIESENVTEVFCAFGEKGKSAENVAEEAASMVQSYLDTTVPVGEHLADQLLLPLSLGKGGTFRTGQLSQHFKTQIDIIQRFLNNKIRTEQENEHSFIVEVSPA
jgi:tRNA-splicing ligase RtcB (3'-phosphate/5'-hydroxy nucleic acid ligase)